MKIQTTGLLPILVAWSAFAGGFDSLELTDREQSAVVSAVMSIDGFAGTNQWVLIKAEKSTSGVERVTVWKKPAKNLSDATSTNKPPSLYATIWFSEWKSDVHYEKKESGNSDMEGAVRQGVAFLAKQGWLPAGFWLTCDREESGFWLFFWTEPNRWPGDHCSIRVTGTSLEYRGGL